jgi:hypothetical protein
MQTKIANRWIAKRSLKLSNLENGMEYVDAANHLKIQYSLNPERKMYQNTNILF